MMSELEYVIANFDEHFASFCGKKILLHGSRDYAQAIIETFGNRYHFLGTVTDDDLEGTFCGLPIYSYEQIDQLKPDIIILTERVKYADKAFLKLQLKAHVPKIFDMYGVDQIKVRKQTARIGHSQKGRSSFWKKAFEDHDVISIEIVDTLIGSFGKAAPLLEKLIREYIDKRVILLVLRKSFDKQAQLDMLEKNGLLDERLKIIERQGEDLSFRTIKETYPDKRIIHIGCGLINEYLLPRCYGIDSLRWDFPGYDSFLYEKTDSQDCSLDLAQACAMIDDHDVVSFDIFDTLLVRKTLFPQDIYDLLEIALKREGIKLQKFAVIRRECEHDSTDLQEIYRKIAFHYCLDAKTADMIAKREIDLERKLTVRRNEVFELYSYALKKQKKIYLVSDMYLHKDTIRSLLSENDINGYEDILVSCDQGTDKRHGLYDKLIARCGEHEKIIHFGDDEEADMAAANKAGLTAFHLPALRQIASESGWRKALRSCTNIYERLMAGMCIEAAFNHPEQSQQERFAGSFLTALICGFVLWLARQERSLKHDLLLFSSRDGYLPQKLYEYIRDHFDPSLPESRYFYTSRKAAFLLEAKRFVTDEYCRSRTFSFDQHKEETLSNIFQLAEKDILPYQGETETAYLQKHSSAIDALSHSAYEGYVSYCSSLGMKEGNTYGLVDFISGKTIQNYLVSLPYRFYGMYAGSRVAPDIDYSSYFKWTDPYLMRHYVELEYYLTSPEPSLKRIAQDGSPLFNEDHRSKQELEQIISCLDIVWHKASEFLELVYEKKVYLKPVLPERLYACKDMDIRQTFYDDFSGNALYVKKAEERSR